MTRCKSIAALIFLALARSQAAAAQEVEPTETPASASSSETGNAPAAASTAPAVQLAPVEARARRLGIDIGPLPGLKLTRDQLPYNVQSATADDLKKSHALNLGDYMNTQLQGVNINDYSGNPFQIDVNYRGFTASPQVGTPQGLSVFFDGVRVNEPFGDVVNWDLIPVNAIERFDLFPGSNPLFGLNTLGGAISVRSKSGFSAPGIDATVTAGSWDRRQLQLSGGINNGEFAGFVAGTLFKEDGWRDNSPSSLGQFYGRGDWALERATLTASVLGSSNDLIGNGLIPIELYEQRPETVFTSPDQSKNKLLQFALAAAFDVSETLNVTSRIYRRDSDRSSYNGDINEDFQDFNSNDLVYDWQRVNPVLPICQFAAGAPDQSMPLNGPVGVGCDYVSYAPSPDAGRPRNGGYLGATGAQTTGVANGGTPIGLISKTALNQVTEGIGVQLNWNLEQHKAMVGASLDRNQADYILRQRLGSIDAAHRVFEDPDNIAYGFGAAFADVIGNQFDGKQSTRSLYFSDVWSPRNNLHLSIAGRYNDTRVQLNSGARARFFGDLGDVDAVLPPYIVCPTTDPASCPSEPVALFDPVKTELQPITEKTSYQSFNPAFGVNWLPRPNLNLFANFSQGSRVPSVVELGCALDLTPTPLDADNPEFGLAPRSLVGSSCSLPTTLSGDPYLPQIRARSGELGMRGRVFRTWEWNLSIYRTDLKNDIYFIGAGSSRSYFDTIDKTRRQGLELGFKGSSGPIDAAVNYSFVDATFQSTFYTLSPSNSSADFDQNSRTIAGDVSFFDGVNTTEFVFLPSATAGNNRGLGTFRNIRVDPGARLPGISAHNLNLNVGWRPVPTWRLGLTMVARSNSYIRGNENNQHRAAGTDQQIGQYYCSSASECESTGFIQIPVPAGRPFTRDGKVPGYASFNFDTRYEITPQWQVSLLITNLLDHKYFTAGRLGVNPFAASTVGEVGPSGWNYNASEWQNTSFVSPAAPRGYFLSLNYAFDSK